MPAIFENILDFEILDIDNPKIIVFLDCSQYMHDNPELPILDVIMPGFNRKSSANIVAKQINILNANTIGITKAVIHDYSCLIDLPDGVYTFTYRICPYDKVQVTKQYLRTTQLNIQVKALYRLLENTDCSLLEDRKLKNKLLDIEQFISGGKAFAEDGNPIKASNFYQIAAKFTSDLLKTLTSKCR